MQYGQDYLRHITGEAKRTHPYFGMICPTCGEDENLTRICPDCRDRAKMHPMDYRYEYKGPASGNQALEQISQERARIDKERHERYIAHRTLECPECQETRFIPEGDYVCGVCRNSMVLGL